MRARSNLRSWFFVGLTALGLFASVAQAHGPTRQKIVVQRSIDASPAACWQVVGDFAALHTWLPPVEQSEIVSGEADSPGAVRRLVVGGKILEETLKSRSDEKHKLKYKMSKSDVEVLPVNNYSAVLQVKPEGEGCLVVWKGAFYRGYPNNDPPENLNEAAAIAAVTGLYNVGLDSLKKLLEAKK